MSKIISKFSERPRGKEVWMTLYLGVGSLIWGLIVATVPMAINQLFYETEDGPFSPPVGLSLVVVEIIIVATALLFGTRAYKKGERSWILMIGLLPAIVVSLFILMFAIGEIFIPH